MTLDAVVGFLEFLNKERYYSISLLESLKSTDASFVSMETCDEYTNIVIYGKGTKIIADVKIGKSGLIEKAVFDLESGED